MNKGCVGCVTFIIFFIVVIGVLTWIHGIGSDGSLRVGDSVEWGETAYSYDEARDEWNEQAWDLEYTGTIDAVYDNHYRVHVTEIYQARGIYSKGYGTESHYVNFYKNVSKDELGAYSYTGGYSIGAWIVAIIVGAFVLYIIGAVMVGLGSNGAGNTGGGGTGGAGGFTPK